MPARWVALIVLIAFVAGMLAVFASLTTGPGPMPGNMPSPMPQPAVTGAKAT